MIIILSICIFIIVLFLYCSLVLASKYDDYNEDNLQQNYNIQIENINYNK